MAQVLSLLIKSAMAQPHHPRNGAESHLAHEPVFKPHVGPRAVVDLSAFPT